VDEERRTAMAASAAEGAAALMAPLSNKYPQFLWNISLQMAGITKFDVEQS